MRRLDWDVSSNVKWVVAGCIVVAVLCLGNLDLLLGRVAPQWDAVDYFGPEFSLVADHLKAGRLLLWDPWVAAGTPDSAEPEFGTTSPIVLLAALLSPNPQAGFVMYWMFIWILGPIGMLVLVRHLRCPAWGGIVAAIGFGISGFYTGHAQHTAHVYSVSLLPWVIWRFDLGLLRRSYWYILQAGTIYGVSALGGYPVYTIVTPAFLILWSIGRAVSHDEEKLPTRRWSESILFAAVAIILLTAIGTAIMSPAYVGFVEDTQGYSDRNGPRARQEALTENLFPAGELSTFASPYLSLVDIRHGRYWPFTDASMRSVYSGGVVMALAMFSLSRNSRWRWWLFLMALLSLVCAMGYQTPVRGWLYDYVPPMRYFRNAASFRTYAILLFAVLSALGARDLSSVGMEESKTKKCFFITAILLAIVAAWTFVVVLHWSNDQISGVVPAVPREILHSGFFFAVTHAFVTWCGVAGVAYLFWQQERTSRRLYCLLVALAIFDGAATLRVSAPTMYSSSTLSFWHVMNAQHSGRLDLSGDHLFRQLEPPAALTYGPPTLYKSNRNIPVKVATVINDDITLKNRFYGQIVADPLLRQMAVGNDRIWFITEAPSAPPTDTNFTVYAQRVHELGAPVVLLHSAEQMKSLGQRAKAEAGSFLLAIDPSTLHTATAAHVFQLSYWPNALSFHFVAPEAGWLVITDRWAPGWRVTVNGHPREVLGADFVYRAVRTEAGDNRVQFRYRPRGWPGLLLLSWGTLLFVGTGWLATSIPWHGHGRSVGESDKSILVSSPPSTEEAESSHLPTCPPACLPGSHWDAKENP